jgi:2-keto-4-pentenoate hydratase/2-oxohepta-3-ene-1,7-dioic acid hydratase in catechol pathway
VEFEGQVFYARYEEGKLSLLDGAPYSGGRETGERVALDRVSLLPPSEPQKIVAVGLNYHSHARELGLRVPEEPLLFLKPPSALLAPGGTILLPRESQRVDYEGELVLVIGARLRRASPQEAREAIFGYTCGNDVTARDLQRRDGQWTRAKGFDTFAPVGPWVVAGPLPSPLHLATYLNGARRQWDSTANLVFSPEELVSHISSVMTLLPGDLVFTGTPAVPSAGEGISASTLSVEISPGDEVEVEVEGVGRLRNRVAAEAGA